MAHLYVAHVLREVKNGLYQRRLTLGGFRHSFWQGSQPLTATWGRARHRALLERQRRMPVELAVVGHRSYWAFEDRFWWEDDGLAPEDVLALVRQRERRRRRQLESAHASLVLDADSAHRREPIPRDLRRAVWQRDGGACVQCGEAFDLQYDHVIPVSRGGATALENLELLCAPCNRSKGDLIG